MNKERTTDCVKVTRDEGDTHCANVNANLMPKDRVLKEKRSCYPTFSFIIYPLACGMLAECNTRMTHDTSCSQMKS